MYIALTWLIDSLVADVQISSCLLERHWHTLPVVGHIVEATPVIDVVGAAANLRAQIGVSVSARVFCRHGMNYENESQHLDKATLLIKRASIDSTCS